MPNATRSQQPKLLDAVRQVLRLHHSSIHIERSSVEWIVRCVRFHGMRSRRDAPCQTHHGMPQRRLVVCLTQECLSTARCSRPCGAVILSATCPLYGGSWCSLERGISQACGSPHVPPRSMASCTTWYRHSRRYPSMSTQPLLCSRCQSAPRLPRQRWCRQCLTSAQRQRRSAARREAQADGATAPVTQASAQEHPTVTHTRQEVPTTAAPMTVTELAHLTQQLLHEIQQHHRIAGQETRP